MDHLSRHAPRSRAAARQPALRVGREGRVVDLTEDHGAALSFSSVLSLPMLLDDLPGEFAAHLGG